MSDEERKAAEDELDAARGVDAVEDEVEDEDEARAAFMKQMEWFAKGPPWWHNPAYWALTGLTALCIACVVMLQWFLWLIVTGNLGLGVWGMGIGLAIWVSQMLLIFQHRTSEPESCPVPKRD